MTPNPVVRGGIVALSVAVLVAFASLPAAAGAGAGTDAAVDGNASAVADGAAPGTTAAAHADVDASVGISANTTADDAGGYLLTNVTSHDCSVPPRGNGSVSASASGRTAGAATANADLSLLSDVRLNGSTDCPTVGNTTATSGGSVNGPSARVAVANATVGADGVEASARLLGTDVAVSTDRSTAAGVDANATVRAAGAEATVTAGADGPTGRSMVDVSTDARSDTDAAGGLLSVGIGR